MLCQISLLWKKSDNMSVYYSVVNIRWRPDNRYVPSEESIREGRRTEIMWELENEETIGNLY